MSQTGYTPAADTLAAPAAVTDSVALMTRRFEEASAETDKETLKEEVLSAISGETGASPVISGEAAPGHSGLDPESKSPAKKEEDE